MTITYAVTVNIPDVGSIPAGVFETATDVARFLSDPERRRTAKELGATFTIEQVLDNSSSTN